MGDGQDTILGTDTVKDALKTKVNDDMAELHLIKDEVVAARDGESTLLAQIDAIQTSVLAVTSNTSSTLVNFFVSSIISSPAVFRTSLRLNYK